MTKNQAIYILAALDIMLENEKSYNLVQTALGSFGMEHVARGMVEMRKYWQLPDQTGNIPG